MLSRKHHWSQPFALHLTALSSGVLLTTALLHLAPEALHMIEEVGGDEHSIFQAIFAAIVGFFLLERLVLWYHHHHEAHGVKPAAWLVMVGDTVHNFIDGVAVAATLMIDPALGLVTIIAVGAHEIPQEIADFAVMVNSGMSKGKALLFNALSALSAFAGALITFALAETVEPYLPWMTAFTAGMFLYIALSDLIPELHHAEGTQSHKWQQVVWFAVGVGGIVLTTTALASRHSH